MAAAAFSIWVGHNYKPAGALTVISYGLAATLSFGLIEVKGKSIEGIKTEHFKEVLRRCHNVSYMVRCIQ